jgi:hypothetical protein
MDAVAHTALFSAHSALRPLYEPRERPDQTQQEADDGEAETELRVFACVVAVARGRRCHGADRLGGELVGESKRAAGRRRRAHRVGLEVCFRLPADGATRDKARMGSAMGAGCVIRLVQDAAGEFHGMKCTPADRTRNGILNKLKNQINEEFQWRLQQLHR